MNHMGAVLARYYTDAYYNCKNGDRSVVPRSWQTAFDAARDKRAAGRFDPTADDSNGPVGLSYAAVMQMLTTSWRENAWRNAEALMSASSPSARSLVAANIESEADIIANSVLLTQSYTSPLTSTATRDAFCAPHRGDAAPLAYPFGMPTPYGG